MGNSYFAFLAAVGHGDAETGGFERAIVVEQVHVAVELRVDAPVFARARYELVRDAAQHDDNAEDDDAAEDDVSDVEPSGFRIAPIQEGHDLPPPRGRHVGGLGCMRMKTRERGVARRAQRAGFSDAGVWKSGVAHAPSKTHPHSRGLFTIDRKRTSLGMGRRPMETLACRTQSSTRVWTRQAWGRAQHIKLELW